MTQFQRISIESIQKAATTVQNGGLVVYPTDTVYGIGCNPFDEKAVDKLAAVKGRSKGNLPVLVGTLGKARELGTFTDGAEALASRFWPGPLTIVVACRATLPFQVVGREQTLGLRIPRRQDTLDLISESGGSLVGTSANISGTPSLTSGEDALKVFEGKVDFVLDGGVLPNIRESTVVRQTENGIQILREGTLSRGDLRSALPRNVHLRE